VAGHPPGGPGNVDGLIDDDRLWNDDRLPGTAPDPQFDDEQRDVLGERFERLPMRPAALSAIRTATCVFPGKRARLAAQ